MIQFLQDYATSAVPPETFEAGQKVDGRSSESEMHFVKRGVAAYVTKDGLVDADHRPIVAAEVTVQVVTASAHRDGETGRAGEVELVDGTPQRGSPGPAEVVTSVAVTAAPTKARK
jgi:hypothetical protein